MDGLGTGKGPHGIWDLFTFKVYQNGKWHVSVERLRRTSAEIGFLVRWGPPRNLALSSMFMARLRRKIVVLLASLQSKGGFELCQERKKASYLAASAACGALLAAPDATRRRRSVSDNRPPKAIRIAPPQIQFAKGFK